MTTGILSAPTVHVYKEINVAMYKTTQHFVLKTVISGNSELTEFINISKNRGFAKSDPEKWLKTKPLKKWFILTGLFYNKEYDLYFGDKGKNNTKEDLIIVQFSKDNDRKLIVYYFKNYYTNDIKKVIHFINQ